MNVNEYGFPWKPNNCHQLQNVFFCRKLFPHCPSQHLHHLEVKAPLVNQQNVLFLALESNNKIPDWYIFIFNVEIFFLIQFLKCSF